MLIAADTKCMVARALICACVPLAFLGACGGSSQPGKRADPIGPPYVRPAVVEQHDRQFAQDAPERPAGSQAEGIAATYLLGHLQQAGYLVRLENVPVEDLVRSSNVTALPPDGGDATLIVGVAYDTPPSRAAGGEAIGTFLEVARAMRVIEPEHSFGFVGLGADNADLDPGRLGSRRLAQLQLDEELEPGIIVIGETHAGGSLTLNGDLAPELREAARVAGVDASISTEPVEVFPAAGLPAAEMSGDAMALGRTLLEFLAKFGV